MIIKPYGYQIWERIQSELDLRIKSAGVQNCYFPLFIPESFLSKEKEHVAGFSPECAVVTHAGGKKLAENLYVRPTSETIMYDTFAKWIQSYRDLPLKINQWANIVRWEMRTRPFLRTTEFLWQEGHTAHATKEEADQEAERALQMYLDFDRDYLSLPVYSGKKSRKETFAGALYTLTTEALAKDGKAIQAGTSHQLGQTFSKAFNIVFQDQVGQNKLVWQTSWGVSTRIIGTVIVCHGDEYGLRLPPKIAPLEVVVIPIYKTDQEKKMICDYLQTTIRRYLKDFRHHLDLRDEVTPGFKFNQWEVKGIPIRLEIGPRDLKENKIILARRDSRVKSSISESHLVEAIQETLSQIQANLLMEALSFQKTHTKEVLSYPEFKTIMEKEGGIVIGHWCEKEECEINIQTETKATIRVVKEEIPKAGKCLICGEKASKKALFAKAY